MDNKTAQTDGSNHRTEVQACWANLASVAEEMERTDIIESLKRQMQRLGMGIFRLVVMGEIKKGKSSFINALLGVPELLPTDTDVATSTVYKILYGAEEKFKVFFLPDVDSGQRPPLLEIAKDDIAAYGTEKGNPGNEKRVDFIGVEFPHPLLQEGLVLVDTPGVGGLFKAHRDITWKYAPNADAVFFVLDSVETNISQDEILFLQELGTKVTSRVYFVQTKIDVAGTEQWQTWARRNQTVLSDKLNLPQDQLRYFPISNKLKEVADLRHSGRHLQMSGFLPLLDFLHRGLMSAKNQQLACDTAQHLTIAVGELLEEIGTRQKIVGAQTQEQWDDLSREYKSAQQEFNEWQRGTYQEVTRDFLRQLGELKQKTSVQLQDELDVAGPILTSIIEPLQRSKFDPKEMNELAGQFQQECIAIAAERIGDVYAAFNKEVYDQIKLVLSRLGESELAPSKSTELATAANGNPIVVQDSLNMRFNVWEETKTCMYGGMAGTMLAQIGVGVTGMLVAPAIPVVLAAYGIGALLGVKLSFDSAQERRRDEAIAKLTAVLQNMLRQTQRQAMAEFNKITGHLERRAEDIFREAVQRRQSALQNRVEEVEQARSRNREENQQALAEVKRRRKRLERVKTGLQEVLSNSGTNR